MLVSLLSTSNYVSFNIKLAHVIGLKESIYLSELLNINDKAIRKDKVDGQYFNIDRDYMEQRTTFCVEEQLEIEKGLLRIGLVSKDDCDRLSVDVSVLTGLIAEENEKVLRNVSDIIGSKRGKTKKQIIHDNLMRSIKTDNAELRDAYSLWIEAVIARCGWMTSAAVRDGEELIDSFTNRTLEPALEILKIAAVNGLRNMQWAVDRYKKEKPKSSFVNTFNADVGLGGKV